MLPRGLAATLLVAAVGCGDPELNELVVPLSGELLDAATGAFVAGRVAGLPDLGEVRTSSATGQFILQGARVGRRYRLRARASGYIEREIDVVPRPGEPAFVQLRLTPAVACEPGALRCAQGGSAAVERCQDDGRGFELTECAEDEVCGDPPRCVPAHRVEASVAGGGAVQSQPSGISCPPTCGASFAEGTALTLDARPFGTTAFESWGGACEGTTEPECNLTISAPVTVEARFRAVRWPLNVDIRGGPGRVESQPSGIDCPGTCTALFAADSEVELFSEPGEGRVFARWERACSGGGACRVTMDRVRNVRARFTAAADEARLTAAVSGAGRLVSEPEGLDCPGTCELTAPIGTSLRLDARPEAGSVPGEWGLDCDGADRLASCEVRLDADHDVALSFVPFYEAPFEVDPACRWLLGFEGSERLASRCGGATASAPTWTPQSGSRTPLLGDRIDVGTEPMRLGPLGLALPFTVELSVRPDHLSDAVLVGTHDRSDADGGGFELRALADGRVSAIGFGGGAGTTSATTSASTLDAGRWTHIALVAESSGLGLFVDGVESARVTGPIAWVASSTAAWVGFARTGTTAAGRFDGAIDELRVSGSARYP